MRNLLSSAAEQNLRFVTKIQKMNTSTKSSGKSVEHIFYVSVKVGSSFEYAGYLNKKTGFYTPGREKTFNYNHPAIKGLFYVISRGHNPLPDPMEMVHHGKCAKCGKKLDDNLSIERRFGPICYKRISID